MGEFRRSKIQVCFITATAFAQLSLLGCGGTVATEEVSTTESSSTLPSTSQTVSGITDSSLSPQMFQLMTQIDTGQLPSRLTEIDQRLKDPNANRKDLLMAAAAGYEAASQLFVQANRSADALTLVTHAWKLAKEADGIPGTYSELPFALGVKTTVFNSYFPLAMTHGSPDQQRLAIQAGLEGKSIEGLSYTSEAFSEKMNDPAFASMVEQMQSEVAAKKLAVAREYLASAPSFSLNLPTHKVDGSEFDADSIMGKPSLVMLLSNGQVNPLLAGYAIDVYQRNRDSINMLAINVVTEPNRDPEAGLGIVSRAFQTLHASSDFLTQFPAPPTMPAFLILDQTGQVRVIVDQTTPISAEVALEAVLEE